MMEKRSKGIIWFVIIACAITWGSVFGIYLIGVPSTQTSQGLPNPVIGLLSILGTFGPAIGAFVVLKWITREGFKDAGLRLNLKTGWKYYLLALFYPLAVIPIALGVAAIAGATITPLNGKLLANLIPLYAAVIFWTPIYFGEEFGWRGYLQVQITPGKPLLAAILTGLIWGIWHYGNVLSGIALTKDPLTFLIYPINLVFISILWSWLRTQSKSVWPACLAHAVGNGVITKMIDLFIPGVPQLLTWGVFTLASYAILALVLVFSHQVKWRESRSPAAGGETNG
jgi:uncharacterized protein